MQINVEKILNPMLAKDTISQSPTSKAWVPYMHHSDSLKPIVQYPYSGWLIANNIAQTKIVNMKCCRLLL